MQETDNNTVFDVRGVTYRYDDVMALDNVSLTIKRGQRVAVLGANGSGKSTLLRLLDGLYFAGAGEIEAFGKPLTEAAFADDDFAYEFRRRVAFVFQNADVQLFNPTVFDEIAFGPLQMRFEAGEIRTRVARVMDQMEIAHLADRSPHRLSGGEKKRVALASVLVLEPGVLLMDEPTAALDPKSRGHIIDHLADRTGEAKTIVIATHELDIIEDVADLCIVFEEGRIAATGTPAAILSNQELLERTNLVHSHRHRHADGKFHTHPHLHRFHEHGHHHHDDDESQKK